MLDNANSTAVMYKMIVEGLDDDKTMSDHKKQEDIQMKARYLAQAYRIAIEEMPFKPGTIAAVTQLINLLCWFISKTSRKKFCNDGMLSFAKRNHFESRVGEKRLTCLPGGSSYRRYRNERVWARESL